MNEIKAIIGPAIMAIGAIVCGLAAVHRIFSTSLFWLILSTAIVALGWAITSELNVKKYFQSQSKKRIAKSITQSKQFMELLRKEIAELNKDLAHGYEEIKIINQDISTCKFNINEAIGKKDESAALTAADSLCILEERLPAIIEKNKHLEGLRKTASDRLLEIRRNLEDAELNEKRLNTELKLKQSAENLSVLQDVSTDIKNKVDIATAINKLDEKENSFYNATERLERFKKDGA